MPHFVTVMGIDGLKEALHQRPYQPFTIRMADGCALPVPHPDFLAVSSRRIVLLAEDGSWCVLEPRLIAALEYGSSASPSTTV